MYDSSLSICKFFLDIYPNLNIFLSFFSSFSLSLLFSCCLYLHVPPSYLSFLKSPHCILLSFLHMYGKLFINLFFGLQTKKVVTNEQLLLQESLLWSFLCLLVLELSLVFTTRGNFTLASTGNNSLYRVKNGQKLVTF